MSTSDGMRVFEPDLERGDRGKGHTISWLKLEEKKESSRGGEIENPPRPEGLCTEERERERERESMCERTKRGKTGEKVRILLKFPFLGSMPPLP
jgi:hypothetical protein